MVEHSTWATVLEVNCISLLICNFTGLQSNTNWLKFFEKFQTYGGALYLGHSLEVAFLGNLRPFLFLFFLSGEIQFD